jgi:hypothetical protein
MILRVDSLPEISELRQLAGARADRGLRSRLAALLPRHQESTVYQLLDDLAGGSLVAPFALTRWLPVLRPGQPLELARPAVGVCTGFMAESSAHLPGAFDNQCLSPAGTPVHPADPDGWHQFTEFAGPATRRSRRIDVSLGDGIEIDAWFQDSSTDPAGGRMVVHEYSISAVADPRTYALAHLSAIPRVLPYDECPLAITKIGSLIGTTLGELRAAVPRRLPGVDGCTHLNDMLRALAGVPVLVAALAEARRPSR